MDPIELLVLAGLGLAGYLFFAGTPSATPAATTTATGATSTPGTVMSVAPAAPAIPQPLSASQMPPDSVFLNAIPWPKMAANYQKRWTALATAMLSQMQMLPGNDPSAPSGGIGGDHCSGVSSSGVTFQQIAGLSAGGANVGVSALATAGIIGTTAAGLATFGIGAVVGLISSIFSHHAQKVKQQAQLDCAASYAANNAWAEIKQAIASGSMSLATAQSAFEEVNTQFAQMVQPMNNMGPGDCNNPCGLTLICRAVTDKFEAMYQMAA